MGSLVEANLFWERVQFLKILGFSTLEYQLICLLDSLV